MRGDLNKEALSQAPKVFSFNKTLRENSETSREFTITTCKRFYSEEFVDARDCHVLQVPRDPVKHLYIKGGLELFIHFLWKN